MALPRFVKIVNGQPTIDIGSMRHSITIQANGPTSPPTYDAAGPALVWTTFATAQAAIGAQASGDEGQGRDVQKGGQVVTQLPILVAIWAVAAPGCKAKMRVVSDNGSLYVIESIEDVLDMGVVYVLNCVALGDSL